MEQPILKPIQKAFKMPLELYLESPTLPNKMLKKPVHLCYVSLGNRQIRSYIIYSLNSTRCLFSLLVGSGGSVRKKCLQLAGVLSAKVYPWGSMLENYQLPAILKTCQTEQDAVHSHNFPKRTEALTITESAQKTVNYQPL